MDTYFASITRADFDLLLARGMIGSVIMFELFQCHRRYFETIINILKCH